MARSKLLALLATGMVALSLLMLPVTASAADKLLTVSQANQFLYPEPELAGTPIAPVPAGAAVKVLQQTADWRRVEYQGKTGWLPPWAFRNGAAPLDLRPILTGEGVKPTSRDEVALAGMAEKQPRGEEFKPVVGKMAAVLTAGQPLFTGPNKGAKAMLKLPAAVKVKVVAQQGSWFKIEYQGKMGWLPSGAVKLD
jgi:uncharacterized protein YgiM (DUF1202 family)